MVIWLPPPACYPDASEPARYRRYKPAATRDASLCQTTEGDMNMGAGTGDMAETALHNFTSVDAAAILENVTDGLALFEANGDIALWNGAMFAINGFPRQLFTGFRNISQAFHWQFENGHLQRSHPTVAEDVAAFMTHFLSGERYVATHLRPNGRWVHVTWRTLPDGRRLLVHRDVTELKQRELELEEARDAIERERATMQAILDNMTDGVALLEADGNFLTVNKAFRALNRFRTTSSQRCAICATPIAGRPLKGTCRCSARHSTNTRNATCGASSWRMAPIDLAATVRALGGRPLPRAAGRAAIECQSRRDGAEGTRTGVEQAPRRG